jgi:hypothetical protein
MVTPTGVKSEDSYWVCVGFRLGNRNFNEQYGLGTLPLLPDYKELLTIAIC